jgi:hypothetical protein
VEKNSTKTDRINRIAKNGTNHCHSEPKMAQSPLRQNCTFTQNAPFICAISGTNTDFHGIPRVAQRMQFK